MTFPPLSEQEALGPDGTGQGLLRGRGVLA
jgi:hypothetical protein